MLRIYLLYLVGPFVAAIAAGLVLAFLERRHSRAAPTPVARKLAAAGAITAFVFLVVPFAAELLLLLLRLPRLTELAWGLRDTPIKYALPLIAALLAVALMACAPARATGVALVRRPIWGFARRGELVWIGVLALVAVAVAIAAGRVSSLDSEGRYRMHEIEAGTQRAATEIYGWYFSVPALIALLLLLIIALVALVRIARPAFGENVDVDAETRKLQSDWVTRTVLSALLVHLGNVGRSLAATASLRMSSQPTLTEPVLEIRPEFAALGPALQVTGTVLSFLGIALWSTVFWRSVLRPSKGVGDSGAVFA
ncbi:hypothetical protein ACXR2T_15525 [Leucobacter sp. HY1910]